MKTTLTALLAALLPAAALAQATPRADPLDATAATAPLVHRSAFTGYKKLAAESPPVAWREANDAVERIGGWRAYAREANAAASAPASPASAPATASPPASAPARAQRPATPAPAHRH